MLALRKSRTGESGFTELLELIYFPPPVAIDHVATIEILRCDLEVMHSQVMVARLVLEIDS